MKILIPGALAYSVEGQQFKPDANGVYDIPDPLVKKINEPWQAAPDQSAEAKDKDEKDAKVEHPAAAKAEADKDKPAEHHASKR